MLMCMCKCECDGRNKATTYITLAMSLLNCSFMQGAVSDVSEKVTWNRVSVPDVIAMRIGTEDQVYYADY